MPTDKTKPIEDGYFYHIYNRAIDNNLLFYQDRNYTYFLWKLSEYISDFIDLYYFCILPNHFHLLR